MNYIKDDGGRMQEYNIKPLKKNQIGDCVVRSIAIALDQSYRQTLTELCELSVKYGGVPNDKQTYEAYLFDRGWIKNKPPRNPYGRKIRLAQWRPLKRTMAIVHTSGHLTAVVNGTVRDNWDCREWCMNSYYTKETA